VSNRGVIGIVALLPGCYDLPCPIRSKEFLLSDTDQQLPADHLASGRRDEVAGMFGRIAGRYDLANTILSAGQDTVWRRTASRALVGALADRGCHDLRILDFCAGTGAQSLSLVEEGFRRGSRVRVVASDLALPMLECLVRRKRKGEGHWGRFGGAVEAVLADAARPPLRTGSLDGAVVSFGIRNVDDYRRCLRGVGRVLRPGGRLAVLEFSMPRQPLLRQLYRFYFRNILPLLGRFLFDAAGAYAYLPDSVDRFPSGAGFVAELREAGFHTVASRPMFAGIVTLYLARWGAGGADR
jgi:demethylmenaquinone methyltransferase/2-methoxy-6-polyprenyl-1,4-benzoquinol methylase